MILFCTAGIFAQQSVDFSGTWVMNNAKSAPEYAKFYNQVTCTIKQNQQTFTIEQVFTGKDGKTNSMQPLTYTLDGKETVKEEQGGIDKQSALWSKDKKTLTLRYIRTANGNDYGSNTSYALSSNCQVLTITTSDLKGENASVQVFNKK